MAECTYAAMYAMRDPKGKTVKDLFPLFFEDDEDREPAEPMTEEDYVMFSDNMMNTIAYEMEYGTQLAEAKVSDEDIINYLIYTGVSAEHIELSK